MAASPIDYSQILGPYPGYPTPPQMNQTAVNGNPFSNFSTNWSQYDPAVAYQQDRQAALNWGNNQSGNLAGQQLNYQQLQQMYGTAANTEGANIANTPGYTSQEMGDIINPGAYQQGETTQAGFDSLDPTQQETAGIQGNPSTFANALNDVSPAMLANVGSASTKADSITGATQQQQGQAIGQEGDTFNAVDANGDLMPSSGYFSDLANDVSGTTSNVNAALDPNKLSLNLDPNYQMSDQEVQELQDQAGETANLSRTADYNKTYQAALAAGNADPMALAALNVQNETMKASDAADAETNARLSAEDAQRTTKMNYAQANLGANQTSAGMRSTAAENLGQFAVGTQQAAENTNLTAAQNLAAMRTGQATTMGNQGLNAAQYTGSQSGANAANYANLYNNALQYQGTQGTNIAEAQNQASTTAAQNLYGIRQGNTQYGQQQQFQQNYLTQQQLSQLYGNAANARIAGQNTALGWATGEQGTATQAGLGINSQQNQAGATTLGNMNTAAGNWGDYNLGTTSQDLGHQFVASVANAPSAFASGAGKGLTS